MAIIAAQVWTGLVDERVEHTQSCLFVPFAVTASSRGDARQSKQPLCGDRGCRAVHGLLIVERIGRASLPVGKRSKSWCAGIPIRNAVGRRSVIDVKVARRHRRLVKGVSRSGSGSVSG